MARILIALILLLAAAARADLVASNDRGDVLRLMGGACSSPTVLALLKPEWRDKFKAGVAMVRGERFEACWIEPDDAPGTLVVFYSDGDMGEYSRAMFKETPGA